MRATSFRHVFALVFATAAMSVPVAVASAPAAHAALPPVTGCGFTLGPITEQGAAGTEIFLVTLRPVNPAQRCTIAVPFTASITANGAAYRNIQHNPLTATETVTFVP